MKKICIFDTSIASTNIGDQIIMRCIEKEMNNIFKKAYCVRIATHQPLCHSYQDIKRNPLVNYLNGCNYRFIGGSNLVLNNMFLPLTQWNINIFNCSGYKNSILLGCGMNKNSKHTNFYTRRFYNKILSKDFIHSVRDEETKKYLEKLGFKAINTGCPTLWSIDEKLCKSIPLKKSDKVVFTLTDYLKDKSNDKKIIEILKDNYKKIYFFPQGIEDLEYLKELTDINNIEILDPSLDAFDDFLKDNKIDYIGTRLHAGIFSIQHGVRSIIIAIDNRARDMKESYNLNCVDREDIDLLNSAINSDIVTNIKINRNKIEKFKNQFR